MGLAIALQARRYSRLEVARNLQWLAAFGVVHGLQEWGDIFIPAQANYLGAPAIRALELAHLAALAISFTCLFQFGVSLIRTNLTKHISVPLQWIPLIVLLIWTGVVIAVLLPVMPNYQEWQRTANALARYAIGFPGALLAAYGLRRHALERIAPLGVPDIVQSLRMAGVMLLLYAIIGGLITPPVGFFPGDVVNTTFFWEVIGVPVMVVRSIIGLVLAVSIIRGLEIFNVETERVIESMEQQQIITAERNRLGRELHDGAIQMVYTAGLLVESAYNIAPPDTPITSRLERAISVLQDGIGMLRRNLDDLRATPSTQSLVDGLRQLTADPRFLTFVDVSLQCNIPATESISPARMEHILSIINEALSNIVRHARAHKATLDATCDAERLHITIQDDGIGISATSRSGYGLRNMRDRARLLGGTLSVVAATRHGTVVTLDIPRGDE